MLQLKSVTIILCWCVGTFKLMACQICVFYGSSLYYLDFELALFQVFFVLRSSDSHVSFLGDDGKILIMGASGDTTDEGERRRTVYNALEGALLVFFVNVVFPHSFSLLPPPFFDVFLCIFRSFLLHVLLLSIHFFLFISCISSLISLMSFMCDRIFQAVA